ncbi:MAG: hypothetical protein ACPLZD_01375 [Candidatus Saccharicenans sp.]|nr:MAG: hypothetical protein C0168_03790 [Candidatus Aminicenantes bacterium]HEK85278.1 hypothetical protein [Candidatus Aminicenantes bacterium]
MAKKIKAALAIISLTGFVLGFSTVSHAQTAENKSGYALLDNLSQIFYEASNSGKWDLEQVGQTLKKLMADARQLRQQNQIDGPFFVRYQRLLGIIKMTAGPDPDGILAPLINREMSRFIGEVRGEEVKGESSEAVKQLALAIRDEIINLRLYLDSLEKREKLIKGWDEKMSWVEEKKKTGAN